MRKEYQLKESQRHGKVLENILKNGIETKRSPQMKDETYDKGMVILGRVLKNLALTKEDIKTYRVLLDDLSDADFLSAIVEICQKTTEIYPGTNIVALIRQCARGGSKEDLHSRALLAWQNVIDTVERCDYFHRGTVWIYTAAVH